MALFQSDLNCFSEMFLLFDSIGTFESYSIRDDDLKFYNSKQMSKIVAIKFDCYG